MLKNCIKKYICENLVTYIGCVLEGRGPCTIFCFALVHCMHDTAKTFLLVSSSVRSCVHDKNKRDKKANLIENMQ